MNNKEKFQKLISDLPSAPKEGSIVNMDEVFERLHNQDMENCLIKMDSNKRLKILQETPEYQKLLKFSLLVRDGRLNANIKVQDFLDTLEPLLHEISSEAFKKLGHDGIDKAYEELKQKKEK